MVPRLQLCRVREAVVREAQTVHALATPPSPAGASPRRDQTNGRRDYLEPTGAMGSPRTNLLLGVVQPDFASIAPSRSTIRETATARKRRKVSIPLVETTVPRDNLS